MALVSENNRWRVALLVKNPTGERARGYVLNVPIFTGVRVAAGFGPRLF